MAKRFIYIVDEVNKWVTVQTNFTMYFCVDNENDFTKLNKIHRKIVEYAFKAGFECVQFLSRREFYTSLKQTWPHNTFNAQTLYVYDFVTPEIFEQMIAYKTANEDVMKKIYKKLGVEYEN